MNNYKNNMIRDIIQGNSKAQYVNYINKRGKRLANKETKDSQSTVNDVKQISNNQNTLNADAMQNKLIFLINNCNNIENKINSLIETQKILAKEINKLSLELNITNANPEKK